MAIWQLDFYLANRARINSDLYCADEESFLSWVDTDSFEDGLGVILAKEESWSKATRQYGKIDGTCVEVSTYKSNEKQIRCRLDFRKVECSLWKEIFLLGKSIDAVIYYEQQLIEIRQDVVMRMLGESAAARFCRNPYLFLEELKRAPETSEG